MTREKGEERAGTIECFPVAPGDIMRNQFQDLPSWLSRDAQHVHLNSASPTTSTLPFKMGVAPKEEGKLMSKTNYSGSRLLSRAAKILFLLLTTVLSTVNAEAAAPVGQTIWIRASATGLFVSADQNRGTWAPLVADRSSVDAWEQFQVIDAGSGFIAFRSVGTGLFVSADQARATYAPLVPIVRA